MSSPSSSRKKLPRLTRFSFLVTVLGLLAGAVLWFTAGPRWAGYTWRAVLIVVLLSLAFDILSSLRRGEI
ncbi:MAG TPA: hypothetical protein VLT87_11865, partial [Thermoanaerobaculia bacterium]|nr:hypothetical protein [Thermoanaerobaculia bacterium]